MAIILQVWHNETGMKKQKEGDNVQLSVPANYDIGLIPRLKKFPIEEVYGKLPHDFVGGGRPSYMAGRLTLARLGEYVAALRRNDLEFNYLLNSACLANREWSRSWQKKLNRLLAELAAMGVTRLTVSSPYLLERIRSTFPYFYIRVGIFAQVDTPSRARFWEDLGANMITLESFSINRDFQRLKAIRSAVSCSLQLIANHPCLPNCAMQSYHQNAFAHASNGEGSLFIDYCFLRCTLLRLKDPSLFLKAAWIRPEDIGEYESLGFTKFKLLERNIPSEDLIRRVVCYSHRQSPPDLAEILLPHGFKSEIQGMSLGLLRHFFKPREVNPLRLRQLYLLANKAGMLSALRSKIVRIKSAELPADFIKRVQNAPCPECSRCTVCSRLAERVVVFDEPARQDLIARLESFGKQLASGSLWNV
jgi:collagenase-like PrtC family protease